MTVTQKNEVTTDIALSISEEAYVEMMRYAHMFSPKECSGTGLVERIDYHDGSVEFEVKKVYLPNQINSGADTEIEDEEMAKVNTQIVLDGDNTLLHKFHWHSHVDMGVFHSSTDESNYDDMKTGDYAVSLVVNKKYDMLGSVHLYAPLRINVLNIEVKPPDIDFDAYIIPSALLKKLEINVERVRKFEKEEEDKRPQYLGFQGKGYQGYVSPWLGGDDETTRIATYGEGLDYDRDFATLLEQGEAQGLFMLFKNSHGDIVGYQNTRTQTYYELSSYIDTLGY